MIVAVLFARSDSVYKAIDGADVFDIHRDARTYAVRRFGGVLSGELTMYSYSQLSGPHRAIFRAAAIRRQMRRVSLCFAAAAAALTSAYFLLPL